jgi:hypothetical protein
LVRWWGFPSEFDELRQPELMVEAAPFYDTDRYDTMDRWQTVRCAAHLELLDEVARMDTAEAWTFDGAASMSGWLVQRYGLSHHTASEWTRVAHALQQLPAIRAAYGTGRMSWDQVRTVTRFANTDTDDELAAEAPSMSVTELRRQAREITLRDVEEAHHARRFGWNFDENNPVLDLNGRLVDADGAVLVKAITRIVSQMQTVDDAYEPFEARCADALVQLASMYLGTDNDPDRATVVVHLDAALIATGTGQAAIEDGPTLTHQTAMRLMCDCRWQISLESESKVIGIGRVSRRIPPWLARTLRRRDKGCRFPGCERTLWVHFHHLIHWAAGGPTDLDNLITVCPLHHRLIHEAGWTISGDPNSEVTWIQPGGTVFPANPDHIWPPKPNYYSDEIYLPDKLRGTTNTDTS